LEGEAEERTRMDSMERPMRIGILHYSCPPLVGGVEEIVSQHASVLHRLGHFISVIAGMGEVYTGDFPVRIEPLLGSRNPRVLKAHSACREGDPSQVRRLTGEIYEILRDWAAGVDVILAHNVLQMPFNLPLTLALRRLAMDPTVPPVVSWTHDSPYLRPDYPGHLDAFPWNVLKRWHPRIHYITISESRREELCSRLGDFGWRVIPNGINPIGFFYLDPKSVRLAEELRLFDRDLVIVQPSRITPRKNLELSIHITYGIKSLGYNVLFMLTGAYDPHERRATAYYRRLKYWIHELGLQENITILAEYTYADGSRLVPDRIFIRDLYLMADLLLMTSKDEGFGLPLLEAGMIKLPIACSEIPPFQEIGTDVCFFRLEDPPLFTAGRIMEYLSRTNTHKMFRKVMRHYVWDGICRREILPYLREVVAQGEKR